MFPDYAGQLDRSALLAKATSRAAGMLSLNGTELGRIIGVSDPTVHRIRSGEAGIIPDSKQGELALLLIRVYESLDDLVGNNDAQRRAWMGSYNRALGGVPSELIQRAQGLVLTLGYLMTRG
jgi:hypothetical protein